MGALLASARQPWQVGVFTGLTMLFMPLFAPTNPMTYNPEAFYNVGSVLIFGAACAALSFRLIPPLSPAFRTRRLRALTLRDVRRLAMGRCHYDWQGHVYGRLTATPNEATPLQRAELLSALSVGGEIIHLRERARHLGVDAELGAALAALAEGRSVQAIAQLSRLDDVLAADNAGEPQNQAVLRARGSILVLEEALTKHAAYFDAGVRT